MNHSERLQSCGTGLPLARHPLALAVASALAKFASIGRARSPNAPIVNNGNFGETAPPFPYALYLALLAIFPLPAAAQSQWRDSAASPIPATTVNSTQINFGGHEWVVIGNGSKDIYQGTIPAPGDYFNGAYGNTAVKQPNGSVTLLLNGNGGASLEEGGGFGSSAFRAYGSSCYSNTYAGSCQTYPNEYNGSDLQGAMGSAAPSGKERDVINARDLAWMSATLPAWGGDFGHYKQNDGINGLAATDQLFWALSFAEWEAIADADIRKYLSSSWLLRSPGHYSYYALAGRSGGGLDVTIYVDNPAFVVRPAFNLNLTSVLFTSDASTASTGKSTATAGSGYTPLATPAAARKFTFLDSSISAPELTLTSAALDFDFDNAPTGAITNGARYISGFLYNASASASTNKDSYAKYAGTASGNFDAADPGSSSTLANGNYTLHIFNEEANDYLYSDFASESVDFTFQVTDGAGAVKDLTLTSDSPFGLDGGTIGLLAQDYTKAWTLGAGGGTLDIKSGINAEISGAIGGTGNLTKEGAGTLILSNASNNYTGATAINGGALQLNDAAAAQNTSGITAASGATLALNFNGAFGKDVTGAGKLTANPGSSNTLTLSGTNDYSGMTTVQSGTLALGGNLASAHLTLLDGAAFNRNSQLHALNNGSLTVHGSATYTGDLSAQNATLNFFLPSNIDNNGTLLTVTGNADITGSAVTLALDGSAASLSVLSEGESIKLIESAGISGAISNAGNKAKLTAGSSFSTDFSLSNNGNNLIASRDVTYVPPVTPPPPPPCMFHLSP